MDASVEFLLQNLKELVVYHVKLISGAEGELGLLRNELDRLKSILKGASKKVNKHETFKTWEKQIRETVYEVEDTIDTCITKMAAEKPKKRRNILKHFQKSIPIDLAKEVRNLRENKVRPLFESFNIANQSIPETDNTRETTNRIRQTRRQTNIVGFEEEADTVIDFLNGTTENLGIITIVGMPGLGKTTLASKVFEDDRITLEHTIRIWVNVSQDLNLERILKTILEKFTDSIPAAGTNLTQVVRDYLSCRKFFIVMDDVWEPDHWKEIEACLPMENERGRVLITSRNNSVGVHANPTRPPHALKNLDQDKSWELLQYEVYKKLDIVPDQLKEVGRTIAINCKGLPLSIVVIGGILLDKMQPMSVSATEDEWKKISKSVESYLVGRGDNNNILENIIALSYAQLSFESRNCFLYLGMFPEDAEIPVKKLARLWIAEGFIQETVKESFEQVAEDIIKDIINRNLLVVVGEKPDGEAKLVRVHDTIRAFCKKEAAFEEQNLFQEIQKPGRGGPFIPPDEIIAQSRRLCIHSYVLKFFEGKPPVSVARSFLCFHKSPIALANTDISPVTEGFERLRVFEAENLKFPRLPAMLLKLMHLRYLTLALTGDEQNYLPETVTNLWNLQTLMLIISSHILEVKADIWKMRRLRHFKTNASIVLKNDTEGKGNDNLQTLGRLSPEHCNNSFVSKAKSLISLGIQGDLSTNVESLCLEKLVFLNKLKLVHAVEHGVASESPMARLPEGSTFPPNLKILVLINTYLDWGQMSKLQGLSSLEKLTLKENACTGNSWKVNETFHHLKLLHIERSDLMHWKASDGTFPNLRFLLIKNCEKLQSVPSSLCENLEMMYMARVNPKAVSSARDIHVARQNEGAKGRVFKLDIAVTDN